MEYIQILRSNLTSLLAIAIFGIVLMTSIQIIFPEPPESDTGHFFLHVGGLTLATFITVLAVLAYRIMLSRRLLLTMIAFIIFMFTEALLLIGEFDSAILNLGNTPSWVLGHLMMFVTLGLLALGMLRND